MDLKKKNMLRNSLWANLLSLQIINNKTDPPYYFHSYFRPVQSLPCSWGQSGQIANPSQDHPAIHAQS